MGLNCSRLGSRPHRSGDNRTNRSNLSFLVCGGSSSRAIHQMEDSPPQFLAHSIEHCNHNIDDVQSPTDQPSSIYSRRIGLASVSTYSENSYENSIAVSEEQGAEDDPRILGIDNHGKYLSENKESVPLPQVSADYSHNESHRNINAATGTSCKEQQSSDPVSVNILATKDAVNGIDSSVNEGVSPICTKVMCASSSATQEVGDLCPTGLSNDIQEDKVMADHNPESESPPHGSDLPVTFQSLGDESFQGVSSGLEFPVSDREQDQGDESMLHVDVVSISSTILSRSSTDASYLEARRNSRRLFWDAFSRRSFRRHEESPFVFPSNNISNTGDQERWLLDISSDFIDDDVSGDSRHLGSRIHILNEQQRHSRSQIWERLHSSLSENSQRNSSCPSGIHSDGACSCDSFSRIEPSSTRASISRIIMLAEALFEVLDEIHGQPVSLALSMVSLPAPESVVDSFPLKKHEKATNGGDNTEQCYICLAEYEDGDKIRVLPCRHEYHMSCVDKWLKEIHGVCPLCRGDVRGSSNECSVSNSEIPTA